MKCKNALDTNYQKPAWKHYMKIETKEKDNVILISISGKIDLYNTKEITQLLEKFIRENKLRIIVNLENVPFMDSSGFVSLVTWTRKFQQYSGSLKILNVTGFVKKIIEQNSMKAILQIYDSENAALESFTQ
ncbi:MAG: STAS domain-containing protein [Leptospiraceae bacterium]|nr:STAS domain-containing protein [Leptospiraceae bacterium]MBK7057520.1 STAS domain-containing protein [Leptospiraceae bacterium]MBL0264938.1 STAS domain-containing protein [Leptospiraceae bacterium]MBP9163501.1 STAS domain-containing protein [Leptospiraceae bacterium]